MSDISVCILTPEWVSVLWQTEDEDGLTEQFRNLEFMITWKDWNDTPQFCFYLN